MFVIATFLVCLFCVFIEYWDIFTAVPSDNNFNVFFKISDIEVVSQRDYVQDKQSSPEKNCHSKIVVQHGCNPDVEQAELISDFEPSNKQREAYEDESAEVH